MQRLNDCLGRPLLLKRPLRLHSRAVLAIKKKIFFLTLLCCFTFSENRYVVLDYATRNMTQVDEPQDSDLNVDHVFSLVLLENSESKTKEFLLAGLTE